MIVQVKWKVGMKNWRYSTNVSLYFENGKRYGYSFNGITNINSSLHVLFIKLIIDIINKKLLSK